MLTLELATMVLCAALAVWIAYTRCPVDEPVSSLEDGADWQPS